MNISPRVSIPLAALVILGVLASCSLLKLSPDSGDLAPSAPAGGTPGGERYPDVLAVELRPQGERVFGVAVTLSSPYDSPERYADGWRVLDPEGSVLGTHTLAHDHAAEQPFTRVQQGLHIPAGIDRVTVEGRDQANGFGGLTLTVEVPE